jgi:hypothetical protein
MNSNYDVTVKLTTVGANEVAASVDKAALAATRLEIAHTRANIAATRLSVSQQRLARETANTEAAQSKAALAALRLAEAQTRAARAAEQFNASMGGTGQFINDLVTRMTGGMAVLYMARQVFGEITDAIKDFAKSGVDLNALLETSQLGIAATILSYREYKDEQGRVIVGEKALGMAFAEGANIQKLLQREAFITTATLEEMLQAYQRLQIGAGSQKTTSQELVHFIGTLGNLAKVTGQSFDELASQTQRVLMGVFTIRSPILAILRSMGIDNETIRSWVKTGDAVKNIQVALGEFLKIGPQINQTWVGVLSNVKDVTQQLSGAAMAPIMESVKKLGNEFVNAFTHTFQEGGATVTEVSEQAKQDARAIGELLRLAFDGATLAVKGFFSTFSTGEKDFKATIFGMLENLARFKSMALEIGQALGQMYKTSLIPAAGAFAIGALAKGGDVESAKKLVDWIVDVGKADYDMTVNWVKNEEKRKQALKDEVQFYRNSIFTAGPGSPDFVGPLQPSPGIGNPKPRELTDADKQLIQQWKDFVALMGARMDFSGLTGISKALAENEIQFQQHMKTIDAWEKKLKTLTPEGLAQAGITGSVRDALDALKGGFKESKGIADEKAIADAEQKYADAYAKIGKLAANTSEDQIEASRKVAQQQLSDLNKIEAANITGAKTYDELMDKFVAIETQRRAASTAIDTKADRQQSEDHLNRMAVLQDRLSAVTLDYYVKQRAEIEKTYDTDVKDIEKRYQGRTAAAEEEIAMAGKVRDARKALLAEEENSIIGYRRKWEEEAARIVRTTDSISGGMAAGLAKIRSTLVSTTEAVEELVVAIWDDLGKAFESGFYDILSGKINSLKDVFKSLWDDILKSFSKMLAQMLERWLITGDAMGSGQGGGFLNRILGGSGTTGQTGYGPTYGGGNSLPMGWSSSQIEGGTVQYSGNTIGPSAGLWSGSGGVTGVAMGALGGAAVVGGIASASGAPGWNRGALIGGALELAGEVVTAIVLGAELGSVFPIIGTAIGAIVGGIIGVLTAANTESHFYLNPLGVGGGGLNATTGAGSEAFKPITSAVAGGVLDTFKASGLTDRSTFAASVAKYIQNYYGKPSTLESGPMSTWEVHAGSAADIAADYKRLMTQIVPTEMMHALFGQVIIGGQDYAGISGGSKFGTAIADKNAPMVRMLTALGFSVDKVTEIAGKIDSYADDPQKFLDWLNTLVGVVVGLHTNVTRLGWTSAQIQADITAAANQTAGEKLAKTAADLTQQAKELSLYAGDQQIAKAKELNDAVNQYWADQEAAIKQLMDMAAQLHTLIQNTLQSMKDARALASGTTQEDIWTKALWGSGGGAFAKGSAPLPGLLGQIYGTTDVTKLPDLVNQALTLITNLFNMLTARLTEIHTLQTQNNTLAGQFGQNAMEMWYAPGQPGALGTGTTTGDLAYMLMHATRSSGQEQLDWIAKLQNAAAARYQEELQQIKEIQDNIRALGDSIQQQKFGFQLEMGTPEQQAGLIMERIKTLQGQIPTATTAAGLKAITDEIQGLVSKYWGMSDKSQGAFEFVGKILDNMQKAADAQYAKLFASVTADNDLIRNMLISAGTLLKNSETATSTELDSLTTTLTTLDDYLGSKFQSSIEAIVAANDPLKKALEDDIPLFTDAGTAANDLGTAASSAATKLNTLGDVIDGVINRIANSGGGGNVVQTIRNNPSLLYSRTGL